MTVTVRRWGNSLGLRIPKTVAHSAGLGEGATLEVRVENGALVLAPVMVPTLKELLGQIKRGSRPELLEWGKPVGREVW